MQLLKFVKQAKGLLCRWCDPSPRPKGRLHIDIFRNGELVEVFEEDNLVVDSSRPLLAALLGGNTANKSITLFSVGTNGTAPVSTDTAITGAYTKTLDTVTYPASNQVQFNFSIASTEANGMAIMEFGLLSTSGALFSRRVRSTALNKASDVSFSGSWIISF